MRFWYDINSVMDDVLDLNFSWPIVSAYSAIFPSRSAAIWQCQRRRKDGWN